MSVFSYLAYAVDGRSKELEQSLNQMPECSTYPSTQDGLLILITESKDLEHEKELQKKLESLAALQCLAMVSGHTEEASA